MCPKCEKPTKVVNVAKDIDEVVRLRECSSCRYRFCTSEFKMDLSDGYDIIKRIRYDMKLKNKKGVKHEN